MTFCEYVAKYMRPQHLKTLGNGNAPATLQYSVAAAVYTYIFSVPCLTETFYHFGDNDRERWDPLFSLYQLPPYQLPNKEPVLSFGLAGTKRSIIYVHTCSVMEW